MAKKERILMGERLKSLRVSANKTQKEVADFVGVSIAVYSSYENDTREPSLSTVTKLADYYRKTIDFLVTGKENHTDRTGMSENTIDALALITKTNDDIARCVDNLLSSEKFGQAMTHLTASWLMELQKTESPQIANLIEHLNTFGLLAGKKSMENIDARASQRMIQEWFLYRSKTLICEAFDDYMKEV